MSQKWVLLQQGALNSQKWLLFLQDVWTSQNSALFLQGVTFQWWNININIFGRRYYRAFISTSSLVRNLLSLTDVKWFIFYSWKVILSKIKIKAKPCAVQNWLAVQWSLVLWILYLASWSVNQMRWLHLLRDLMWYV